MCWFFLGAWAQSPTPTWEPARPEPILATAVVPLAVAPLLVRPEVDLSAHTLRTELVSMAQGLGWPIEGADDEVFGQGAQPARYVLGGAIEAIYDTSFRKASGTGMDVRWELRDQAAGTVVYRVLTRGFTARSGQEALLSAFQSATASLLARELFAAVALRPLAGRIITMPICAAQDADPLPSVVEITQEGGAGRGGIVSPSGHIWTAAQVVAGAREANRTIWVTLANGLRLEGEVLATDAARDVAVLKMSGDAFPCRPPGGRAAVGTPISVGGPGRLLAGVIRAERTSDSAQLLQIEGGAAAARGAPVFDGSGALVGIVGSTPASEGPSFTTPASVVLGALALEIGAPLGGALLTDSPQLVLDTPDPPIEPPVAEICLFRTSPGAIEQYKVGRFTFSLAPQEASCVAVPRGSYDVGKVEGGVPVRVSAKDGDQICVRALKAGLSLSNSRTYRKFLDRGEVVVVEGPSDQ